ncbi:MAG TPA: hypothetical protein VM324_16415 [Egibacteraceae bacterium]|jgi:branched-subunit amino acid transport protein AzlD|nr:hypothetical protein [Egibacteraceae bacterium]
MIERLPAPLFAGLAVLTLLGGEVHLPSMPILVSAGVALALTWTRSLLIILAGGLIAYLVAASLAA